MDPVAKRFLLVFMWIIQVLLVAGQLFDNAEMWWWVLCIIPAITFVPVVVDHILKGR